MEIEESYPFSNGAISMMLSRHVRGQAGIRNSGHQKLNDDARKSGKGVVISCYRVRGQLVFLVDELQRVTLHIATESDLRDFGLWELVDAQNKETEEASAISAREAA